MNPRSCLRWQLTGRILKTVGLRVVPQGKFIQLFTSKQNTLIAARSTSVFMAMMSDHNSLDLTPQRQEMYVENVSSGLIPQGQKASDYDNSAPCPQDKMLFLKQRRQIPQQGKRANSLPWSATHITIQHTVMMRTTTMIKHRMHHFKKLNLSILFVHGYKKLVKSFPHHLLIPDVHSISTTKSYYRGPEIIH
ncbi:hypothetical protein Tco_0729972 [Tanacetum coccineum]|uniref:Uncharacterized protein n=1 Tax=Tanacetum coccineum TaxID=301880 RepID=A0ABQ4YRK1_9ASTR